MLQKIRWFFALLLGTLLLIVAFQNHDPVELDLLTFQGRYPLSLLLLATAAISFTLGCLVTAWRQRARRRAADKKLIEKQAVEKVDKKAADTPLTADRPDSNAT